MYGGECGGAAELRAPPPPRIDLSDVVLAYQIGPDQAVNITAIVGQKGQGHFYHCGDTHSGSNVLSVAFDPNELTMYAAWEAFSGTVTHHKTPHVHRL